MALRLKARRVALFVPPLFLALALSFRGGAHAGVMSGPDSELTKLDLHGAGGPESNGGGTIQLAYGLAQSGGVGVLENGPYWLSGGFYNAVGGFAAGRLVTPGGACPSPSIRNSLGTIMGVPITLPVCVDFDKDMLPSNFASAVRVRQLRDRDGSLMDNSVPVLTGYQQSPRRILITSPAGSWDGNALYSVEIGTEAMDQDGNPLANPTTFQFLTLADPSMVNIFSAIDDPRTRLWVGPGALPQPGTVEFNTQVLTSPQAVDASAIQAANAKLASLYGPFSSSRLLREIHFIAYADGNYPRVEAAFPSGSAVLSLPFDDNDGDGIIDGSNPPAQVGSSGLFHLDESLALWVQLPDSRQQGADAFSAPVPHLSVFSLISVENTSLSNAYAFPVPFRPHGPDAGLGAGRTGTNASGITFTNLPARASVDVYNVRGERVWRGEEADGDGRLAWNVRNTAGEPVASGVYPYVIRNSNGASKAGKLAIVR